MNLVIAALDALVNNKQGGKLLTWEKYAAVSTAAINYQYN